MTLKTSLNELKGVGEVLDKRLEAAGLKTVEDLINYFPRRYDDYSHVITIAEIKPGLVSLKVRLTEITQRRARRGLHITEAVAEDETGRVKVIWFNQPYRGGSIKRDTPYYLSGEFVFQRQRLQIINPTIELADESATTHTARILPTYRESGAINSVLIRKLISQVLPVVDKMPEIQPSCIVKDFNLISYAQAIRAIHFPSDSNQLSEAKKRLGFDELFVVMMAAQTLRDQFVSSKAVTVPFKQKLAIEFVEHLPFKLTDAQRKTVWQIYKDIDSQKPMNRLIEGDVGSGKTVVAAMASLMVADAGLQVAFIAPTELLARQHAETLSMLMSHSSLKDRIAMLTGSVKTAAKNELKQRLKNNEISVLVGTHALFQESVDWHHLGLVIIDEQHRFGVEQRQKLHTKAGHMPHVLCLTATPIPRSLALTVYGELDISVLNQSPSNRAGVETSIVSPNSTTQMFESIDKQLQAGHQVYVVCPLITESDVLQVASAEKLYKELSQKEFKKWRVGLLHGRLKSDQKDKIMQQFVAHKLDVLVATTVIEVGVDVANATVMVIEGADRFGLAQLHQLRGRVGRAEHKGHCYLVMSDSSAPSRRMQAIASTANGFELADLDLEIRGPGAIYGTRQHGELDLRIAQLTDVKLISSARQAAQEFIDRKENLKKYPHLSERVDSLRAITNLN